MFKFKKLLSCSKVMFLHLSVILFTRGGSLSRGVFVQGSLSKRVSVQGGLCPGVSIQAGLCPGGSVSEGGLCAGWWVFLCRGGSVRETPQTVTCGWYASYWNAFLLYTLLACHISGGSSKKILGRGPRPLSNFLHVYAIFRKKIPL